MSTLKQTADKALHLGKQLQAVIEVGEALDRLGDLEAAQVEMTAATEACRAGQAEAKGHLRQTLEQLSAAQEQLKATNAEVIRVLDDGNIARDRLLGQARETRDKMVAAATQNAQAQLDAAGQKVKVADDQRKEIQAEIGELTTTLEALRYEMHQLRERLS